MNADLAIGWEIFEIIWINILLSGDNAVVIALAARGLPPEQQRKAILFGSGAAVVLRIGLTIIAAWLMALQGLQIVGGLLLLWIGAQLLADEEESEDEAKEPIKEETLSDGTRIEQWNYRRDRLDEDGALISRYLLTTVGRVVMNSTIIDAVAAA